MNSYPIDKYYNEAVDFINNLETKEFLSTAILDYWGKAIRIIYGGSSTEHCINDCTNCKFYNTFGKDPEEKKEFMTTLAEANQTQLAIFSSKQKYINCKTLDQYLESFILWLILKCDNKEKLEAELDLVKGFRIIYEKYSDNLSEREKEVKKYIIDETLRRIDSNDTKKNMIISYSEKLGII